MKKFEPPKLELSDVTDIKQLTKEELMKVPHDVWRIYCKVQNCNRYTRIRDFGIWPELYGRFKSGDWINVDTCFFVCAGHWKFFKGEMDKAPLKYFKSMDTIRKTLNENNEPMPESHKNIADDKGDGR